MRGLRRSVYFLALLSSSCLWGNFVGALDGARAASGVTWRSDEGDAREGLSGSKWGRLKKVTVLVLGDASFRRDSRWMVDVTRIFMDVNLSFREAIDIRFVVISYDYWDSSSSAGSQPSLAPRTIPSLRPLLPALGRYGDRSRRGLPVVNGPDRVGRRRPDIVCGLVPEGPEGPVNPGAADYLNGLIILKYLKKQNGMSFVLLHELCHLFGAIDLKEGGSVMSLHRPAFRIDAFTRDIMRINRERSFRPGECPLDEDGLVQAISLYGRRQSRGLGEDELGVCLKTLKAKLVALRR
jgi:hypothetical protein